MKITSIIHVGVTVKNLEKSTLFYRDILGFRQIPQANTHVFSDEQVGKGVGVPGAAIRSILFEVVEGQILELLEYVAPPSSVEKPLPQNTLGAMHISFKVDNIQEWFEKLSVKGINFFYNPMLISEGAMKGIWWAYFTDPDGIVLELMEDTNNKQTD